MQFEARTFFKKNLLWRSQTCELKSHSQTKALGLLFEKTRELEEKGMSSFFLLSIFLKILRSISIHSITRKCDTSIEKMIEIFMIRDFRV